MSTLITVDEFTRVMREADRAFESVGGSARHHVRDCLFPVMEREGMVVVRSMYSASEMGVMNAAPRMLVALRRAIPMLEWDLERTKDMVADNPDDPNGIVVLASDMETLRLAQEAIAHAEGKS